MDRYPVPGCGQAEEGQQRGAFRVRCGVGSRCRFAQGPVDEVEETSIPGGFPDPGEDGIPGEPGGAGWSRVEPGGVGWGRVGSGGFGWGRVGSEAMRITGSSRLLGSLKKKMRSK